MAIHIHLKDSTSKEFQDAFIDRIKSNHITTWVVDEDKDITIKREDWRNKAWMRFLRINAQEIVIGIVESKKYRLTKEIYGVFHGRFLVTMLTHFDNILESIEVTPLLDKGADVFSPRVTELNSK